MTEHIIQRPCVVVGLLVENDEHKFLMVRGAKWEGKFFIPGGKVEWGETIEQAARRELQEETGLTFDTLEYITLTEVVCLPQYNPNKHHVTLIYRVRTKNKPSDVVLEKRELTEHAWLTVDEILNRTDIVALDHDIFEKLKKQAETSGTTEEYKLGWQRALADYKNLQKEVNDKRGEWAALSKQQILDDFIPVYDNFKTAFASKEPSSAEVSTSAKATADVPAGKQDNWVKGIGYIMKQFGDVLKSHGLEEIPTDGAQFDPSLHEAVGEEEADGVASGTIVRCVALGYRLAGRVVRPAKVIIAK